MKNCNCNLDKKVVSPGKSHNPKSFHIADQIAHLKSKGSPFRHIENLFGEVKTRFFSESSASDSRIFEFVPNVTAIHDLFEHADDHINLRLPDGAMASLLKVQPLVQQGFVWKTASPEVTTKKQSLTSPTYDWGLH